MDEIAYNAINTDASSQIDILNATSARKNNLSVKEINAEHPIANTEEAKDIDDEEIETLHEVVKVEFGIGCEVKESPNDSTFR